ncbi:hypothetical protein [Lentilactobacillus otakiensis]|uniref:hypothetical protein n=1 Tax=Lentilactobacillus otakiensis TaxID=481720 RepID=UPI003D16B85E
MRKLFVIGISLLIGITLVGCAASTTNQPAKRQEVWPTKTTLYKAENIAQDLDQVEFGNKTSKDNYVRYSDVIDFKNPTKYTGTAKTITGEVVQITKQKAGLRQFILDASEYGKERVWVIDSYTDQNIRTKDNLAVGAIIVGPAKYYNSDNQPVKAIMGFAKDDEIRNMGATGE